MANPVLKFDEPLVIQNAEQIRARIADALREDPSTVIDCSAVTEMDLTFIQILIAANRLTQTVGRHFQLSEPAGGVLLETLRRAGILPSDRPEDRFWLKQDMDA
jgi:anti-anti-sigma regulatory factor